MAYWLPILNPSSPQIIPGSHLRGTAVHGEEIHSSDEAASAARDQATTDEPRLRAADEDAAGFGAEAGALAGGAGLVVHEAGVEATGVFRFGLAEEAIDVEDDAF